MALTENPVLGLALDYAEKLHIPVFPVDADKHPVCDHGFHDANTDPRAIRSMFNKAGKRATGVGGYLGGAGFVAVDLDVKGDDDGHRDLALLEVHYGEPAPTDTPTVITPSGGRHLWFKTNGNPVGSVNHPTVPDLPGGPRRVAVDVKGVGGYVVLPGSVAGGGAYEWADGLSAFDGVAPAPAPAWLAKLAPGGDGDRKATKALPDEAAEWVAEHTTTDPILELRDCTTGRHDRAKAIICSAVGRAAWGHHVDLADVVARTKDALAHARRNDPGHRDTDAEVDELVAWAVAQEKAKGEPRGGATASSDEDAGADTAGPVDRLPQPIDWATLFAREVDYEWLVEDLWPAGRQLHIFASRKTGKSLVMLYIAVCLAIGRDPFTGEPRDPVRVVYLDYEMSEEDLLERVEDMGVGPDQLGLLRYYLHPPIPPLDTAAGGDALVELLTRDEAAVVVIDTVSRVVAGEENSADTFRALWRNTGMRLKAAGVALARLDHEGHEAGRSRGSSAKADDVDVVWRLAKADNGYSFTRKAARMAWVPELVEVSRADDPLRFTRTKGTWPAGTKAIAERLDALGAPLEIPRRAARDLLAANTPEGQPVGKNEVIAKAIKYRKMRSL